MKTIVDGIVNNGTSSHWLLYKKKAIIHCVVDSIGNHFARLGTYFKPCKLPFSFLATVSLRLNCAFTALGRTKRTSTNACDARKMSGHVTGDLRKEEKK